MIPITLKECQVSTDETSSVREIDLNPRYIVGMSDTRPEVRYNAQARTSIQLINGDIVQVVQTRKEIRDLCYQVSTMGITVAGSDLIRATGRLGITDGNRHGGGPRGDKMGTW